MTKERKRRGRGRPKSVDRHAQPRIAFHLPENMLDALDVYIERAKPRPGLSAVLRLALEEFLAKEGLWPPESE